MLGVIFKVSGDGKRGKIAAPYVSNFVELHRFNLQTNIALTPELVGKVVVFKLRRNRRGWFATDAWISSGSVPENAELNRREIDEFFSKREQWSPSRKV